MSGDYSPKIGLQLMVDLPDEFVADFRSRLDLEKGDFEVRQIYSNVFAGVALYLPQAIGLFILTAYFGSIFSKIGEEHYAKVKEGFKYLWNLARLIEITPIGTKAKIRDAENFQLSFSITGQTPDGTAFKLVLLKELDETLADQGIERFLDLIRDINLGRLSAEEHAKILEYKAVGGTVVVTVDPMTGEIVPVSNRPD